MGDLLSIIIVNYKTPGLLSACLRTLYDQPHTLPYEVIVVDNDSRDDSESVIKTGFPQARWIQMGYNSGFARANNEGIRRSNGDTVLLLNSDTLNTDNAVDRCFRSFIQSPYTACGVQLLNADLSPQISGNYFMKGGLNNLLPLPYTGAFIKWLGGVAKVKKPHVENSDAEVMVDWINGAFLMVKKTAIAQAGYMDEDFFLYAEEAEWCARLGKTGKMVIYGQYKIIHLQGETSNATFNSSGKGYYNLYDKKGFQIMLSNFVRLRKQSGTGWFLFQLLVYTLTVPVYCTGDLFRIISGRKPTGNASVAKFSGNVMRLWQFSPIIIRNKPFFYKVL
ncbi:MAG: glycosyltransferase family 2 protein [Chitinophagaceae bacterium]|nr:glycosyltransferase family 2 protein [Chitinophagaceae bacterium]